MKFINLSIEYNQKFIEMISDYNIEAQNKGHKYGYLNYFYPSFGIEQNKTTDFLILGQAVNDWYNLPYPSKDFDSKIESIVDFSNRNFEDHSPLDWVNVYWSKSSYKNFIKEGENDFYKKIRYQPCRSFFWNVTYKLISEYFSFDKESWNWSKNLVWSNLYKIAPPSANPSVEERKIQLDYSIELIKMELNEIKPKYCIVMTNDEWWEPFRNALKTKKINFLDSYKMIQSVERYNDTLIIVTKRPRFGSSDNYTKKILEIIKVNS